MKETKKRNEKNMIMITLMAMTNKIINVFALLAKKSKKKIIVIPPHYTNTVIRNENIEGINSNNIDNNDVFVSQTKTVRRIG